MHGEDKQLPAPHICTNPLQQEAALRTLRGQLTMKALLPGWEGVPGGGVSIYAGLQGPAGMVP